MQAYFPENCFRRLIVTFRRLIHADLLFMHNPVFLLAPMDLWLLVVIFEVQSCLSSKVIPARTCIHEYIHIYDFYCIVVVIEILNQNS